MPPATKPPPAAAPVQQCRRRLRGVNDSSSCLNLASGHLSALSCGGGQPTQGSHREFLIPAAAGERWPVGPALRQPGRQPQRRLLDAAPPSDWTKI